MLTVPLTQRPAWQPALAARPAASPWAYRLFLVVATLLLIRPSELVTTLEPVPLYEIGIVLCLLAAVPVVLEQFTLRSLSARPITVLVVLLLPATFLACALNGYLERAVDSSIDFLKVLVFYFLMVGALRDGERLRSFFFWMALCILAMAILALLAFHGFLDVPALAPLLDGEPDEGGGQRNFARLRGAGLFHDPNDMAMMLAIGMIVSVYGLAATRRFWLKWLWLPALGVQGYALMLTHSRGGFLALVAGVLALLWQRFGLVKTSLLAVALLPGLFFFFGGRQTDISLSDSTGQERIQLWSDGLSMLRESPLFGIGEGQFNERAGFVAHNSFIHTYAELGFLGGTLFLGAWVFALWGLWRLGRGDTRIADSQLAQMRPYLFATLATYAAGMMSLSRSYIVPTYLILALGTSYLAVTPITPPVAGFRTNGRLWLRIAVWGVVFVVAAYVFVRLLVRWS